MRIKTCIIKIKYIHLHRFFEETRMKVTIIQNDVRWLEPQHNMKLVSEMIDRAEKSDIYVFPVWARYMGDFDAIIVTANWPYSRIAAWDILAKARAIENQCYVVACNRVGDDPNNNYVGHSVIIKPDGTVLASCAEDKHTIITARMSIDELNSNRQLYRFLEDRDNK